jgi:hypothetical protein
MNALAHRAKVPWRRATATIVRLATMIVAAIIPGRVTRLIPRLATAIIVLALLRTAAVVIVALIGAGVQKRRRTQHQYAQTGNQTFRHFHREFPHCTYSKKGFRTVS